jgi:YHS domain-containing protein
MVALFLRLLAFIAGLWLIRWLGALLFRGSPAFRRQPDPPAGGPLESTRMVKDPVCGMYMDARLAVKVSTREGPVYFCSEECRKRFDAGAS